MDMELWDLYDKDGNRTGEIWERRHGNYVAIPEARYHLVSDILVQHRDGSYLLTKRHQGKDLYPGYWEASAGGSAQLGEDPEDCAKRELFEETGILCDSFELVKITFSNRSPSLIYSYLARVDCDKNSVVLQEGETTEYKWVDAAGLIEYATSELAIKSSVERYKSFYDKVRAQISVNITDMELSHIAEYAELFVSVFNAEPWNDEWTKETAQIRIENMMKTNTFIGKALYAGNDLKGLIWGQKKQHYNGMHFHIEEFCVKTPEQNKGFGSALLKALEGALSEIGVSNIYLITSKGDKTEGYYSKRGFVSSDNMVLMTKHSFCEKTEK